MSYQKLNDFVSSDYYCSKKGWSREEKSGTMAEAADILKKTPKADITRLIAEIELSIPGSKNDLTHCWSPRERLNYLLSILFGKVID